MSGLDREQPSASNGVDDEKRPGGIPPASHQSRSGLVEDEESQPKPGLLKRIKTWTGLDLFTVLIMIKGGLAPIIALSAYQSDRWAREYTTLGYLVAIMSFLSLPILPRARFFQNLVISIFAICLAAALALLAVQCTVAARRDSRHPEEYSGAASATACAFLFFFLYLANSVHAALPQLLVAPIQFMVFVLVSATYMPTFPDMDAGMDFVQRLLKVFLTGFALATVVSLFIIPLSSRMIVSKQIVGVMNLMKKSLSIHTAYLHGITTSHSGSAGLLDENGKPLPVDRNPAAEVSKQNAEDAAKDLKLTIQKASHLFGQLRLEIGYAKKEIGWGKLQPEDFSRILERLQSILLPVAGLSTFIDILQSVRHHKAKGENLISDVDAVEAIRRLEADEWQEVVVMSRVPFQKMKATLVDGLTHVSYVLELTSPPKSAQNDVEKNGGGSPVPGDPAFAQHLKEQIKVFQEHRQKTMQKWCEKKGIEVPSRFWEDPSTQYKFDDSDSLSDAVRQKQNQQQLYLILYLEYLLLSVCHAILDMVLFADSKLHDGKWSKKRLILPGWRRIKKLIQNAFTPMDSNEGIQDGLAGDIYISLGQSLAGRKDPEHLPPATWYQKASDHVRLISGALGSDASKYGFRAAVASISLAIIGYIRQSHRFYLDQRGVWAVIMVAISMGPNAGAGVQGFLAKITGTAVSTVASMAVWYMGDEKPAAVLPLTYLVFVAAIYLIAKHPKHLVTGAICVVTTILIVGYELQDLKLGTAVVTSTGQPYYKIYILGPYRLATVIIGLGTAFFWTYFPYPVTTHRTLRKDVGSTLYLLANYYSCTHSTVELRLRHGMKVNMQDKNCPIRKLDKARLKAFDKLMAMLNRLREDSGFIKYELSFGGKFPKETYDELIVHMQSLFNYMALTAYSATTFSTNEEGEESEWLKEFRQVTSKSCLTSNELISTLCLASASMTNSQPLPPYITVPRPIHIADQLSAVDPGILSIKHIKEPCYAAFAVLEIANLLVMQEMAAVLTKIKELVGEVDFSVHVVDPDAVLGSLSSSDSGKVQSRTTQTVGVKGKAD